LPGSTPPVGQKATPGNTLASALMCPGPPAEDAGKIFTTSAPACSAARTSVGVSAPSISAAPASAQASVRLGSIQGATMKRAPASRQRRAVRSSGTVPAPMIRVGSAASSRISAGASGMVMVISKMRMPASRSQPMIGSSGMDNPPPAMVARRGFGGKSVALQRLPGAGFERGCLGVQAVDAAAERAQRIAVEVQRSAEAGDAGLQRAHGIAPGGDGILLAGERVVEGGEGRGQALARVVVRCGFDRPDALGEGNDVG
jgi:hypothetical protein